MLARYPAVRPAGFHCFQWYAGELYERFADDIGIYFLTDWLVTNWDRAVINGLGLDRFPWLKDTYFGNITRILFVRQHPDAEREAKAREIAAWMDAPLEIHDLGIEPLERAADPPDGPKMEDRVTMFEPEHAPQRPRPQEQEETIHETAMRILEEIGTDVMHERRAEAARARPGLKVDGRRVYWDRGVRDGAGREGAVDRSACARATPSARSRGSAPRACRC